MMHGMIETHRQIIDCWPTQKAFADDIGVAYETVRKWHQRSSIPAASWMLIVDAAAARGYDVKLDDLARSVSAA